MPILVLHEKHEDRYVTVPEGKIDEVFLAVVRERDQAGWWYTHLSEDEWRALESARGGDTRAARRMMLMRCDHEYEGWDLVTPEVIVDG